MATCPPGCQCGRHNPAKRQDQSLTCVECGEPFTARRSDAKFCTPTCRVRAYERDNRKQVRAAQKKWRAANREHLREYGKMPEAKAKRRQRYADAVSTPEGADAKQEYNRRYYEENSERLKEYAREQRAKQPHRARFYQHGMEWELLFRSLWEAQEGRCYLCGDPLDLDGDRQVHLDHDHSCCGPERTCEKCRRGLACKQCNFVIAWASDDPDRLRRIADSLEAVMADIRNRAGEVA